MGKLVSAAITPHAISSIKEIAGKDTDLYTKTRESMKLIGKHIMEKKPDTIVILTPHGMRLKDYNAIYLTEYCSGSLSRYGEPVHLDYKCNKPLANEILTQAINEGIPSVGCNYGGLTGKGSNIAMDWGTFVPLWYCQDESYQPEIVVIGPTRDIPLTQLVRLGEIIAECILSSDKKVSLIASADQSHSHDYPGTPYGYHESSKVYDEKVIELIKEDNLAELVNLDLEFVENAKPDSLWQMIMLYGASKVVPMRGEFISYEVPTYFGLIVAKYHVID